MTTSASKLRIPLSIGDIAKRVFLGKPLITEDLAAEKLSNPVALGALSPDAISSTAYGTEQILIELLPAAGLAAFALLLPITGVILVILVLVAASYRQVVMTYTRAGGSYIVARENFGPRVAQVAAAALLIDYVVTVAVQAAAGTVAVVSAIPALGPYSLAITVGVVILICYANLRGLREAGRPFAVPTYFFVAMITLMIVTGVIREIFGDLPVYDPHAHRRSGAGPSGQRLGDGRDDPGVAPCVRQRRFVADGSRGDLQYRHRFPEAAGPQRASGAHRNGLHSRVPAGWCGLPGLRHPRHPVCRRLSVGVIRRSPVRSSAPG